MTSESSSAFSSPPAKRKRVSVNRADDAVHDAKSADVAAISEDAVALSHAERRRKKKRDQKAPDKPSKKRKLVDGSVANVSLKESKFAGKSQPKRQNSVWVGNLWFKTTPDALRDFFDDVGEITRMHIPSKKGIKGEIIGFAYVDFATPDAKATAISLSERELHGRNLLIKDADDFVGRPVSKYIEGAQENFAERSGGKSTSCLTKTQQKILRVQKQPPAPTLFLGNLGFDTSEDSIRQLFEAHRHPQKVEKGTKNHDHAGDAEVIKDVWIRKIRMGTFEDSGACKGFAFVDFTTIEYATAALINPRNHRLNGRDLVVEYASADAVRRGGGPRVPKNEHKSGLEKSHSGRQQPNAEPRPRSHSHPRMRGEVEQEHRDDAEPPLRWSQKEAPSHPQTDRSRRRPKPGAALAKAPRESAAIIPSQGQKIVF